jgi:hypothetical protein
MQNLNQSNLQHFSTVLKYFDIKSTIKAILNAGFTQIVLFSMLETRLFPAWSKYFDRPDSVTVRKQ